MIIMAGMGEKQRRVTYSDERMQRTDLVKNIFVIFQCECMYVSLLCKQDEEERGEKRGSGCWNLYPAEYQPQSPPTPV